MQTTTVNVYTDPQGRYIKRPDPIDTTPDVMDYIKDTDPELWKAILGYSERKRQYTIYRMQDNPGYKAFKEYRINKYTPKLAGTAEAAHDSSIPTWKIQHAIVYALNRGRNQIKVNGTEIVFIFNKK